MMKVAIRATTAKPAFILGHSPQDKKTVTTLRVIPMARGSIDTPKPNKNYEGRNLKRGSRGPTVRKTHFLPLP
jgi:hypothetical protein